MSEADINFYVDNTLRNNDQVRKWVMSIWKPYAHALLKAFHGQKCGKKTYISFNSVRKLKLKMKSFKNNFAEVLVVLSQFEEF